ncbi:hypothetical protein XENTR_v10021717 [Xenopus tropicalis]|nr:hypothetical protein XENTR_v10021717 [Xenopus tropicalis]
MDLGKGKALVLLREGDKKTISGFSDHNLLALPSSGCCNSLVQAFMQILVLAVVFDWLWPDATPFICSQEMYTKGAIFFFYNSSFLC